MAIWRFTLALFLLSDMRCRAANCFGSCYTSSSSYCFLYKLTAVQINEIVALAQDVGDLVLVFVSAINAVRKRPLQSIQKPFYAERIKSRLVLNAVKAAIIKTLRLQVWPQKCYSDAAGIQSFLSGLPSLAFIYLLTNFHKFHVFRAFHKASVFTGILLIWESQLPVFKALLQALADRGGSMNVW